MLENFLSRSRKVLAKITLMELIFFYQIMNYKKTRIEKRNKLSARQVIFLKQKFLTLFMVYQSAKQNYVTTTLSSWANPGRQFSLFNFYLKYIYRCNILSQKPGVQPNKSVQQLMTKQDEKFLLSPGETRIEGNFPRYFGVLSVRQKYFFTRNRIFDIYIALES